MPTFDEQVSTFISMLQSLPSLAQLSTWRQALPCGYAQTKAWLQSGPDPTVISTLAALTRDMGLINRLRGFAPDQIAGLGAVSPDDPRLPAALARIRTVWPSPEQIDQVVQLFNCVIRTIDQTIDAGPKMTTDPMSPGPKVIQALKNAEGKLGLSTSQLKSVLEGLQGALGSLRGFAPGNATSLGSTLILANVAAPEINSVFSTTSVVHPTDTVTPFSVPGATGQAFLQSRVLPAGEVGTIGRGLVNYQFRVDLTRLAAETARAKVDQLTVPFGDVSQLAYAHGGPADVFVITKGAIGTVAPTWARKSGHLLSIGFSPAIAAGQSSCFVGVSSRATPVGSTAMVSATGGPVPVAASTAFPTF